MIDKLADITKDSEAFVQQVKTSSGNLPSSIITRDWCSNKTNSHKYKEKTGIYYRKSQPQCVRKVIGNMINKEWTSHFMLLSDVGSCRVLKSKMQDFLKEYKERNQIMIQKN